MDIPLSDAKARLTDLVRRAEAGEEVTLTRHGVPAARIVPVAPQVSPEKKKLLLRSLRGAARSGSAAEAARSQDFLYGDNGLPA